MSEFYKMEPLRWDRGTDNLTLEQEAAYLRICNAIYAADQPISENYRALGGMWRCNERKAKRLLAELIEAGKVYVEAGWIKNDKALDDVSIRLQLRVKRKLAGHSGGIESGKSRAKPLENNENDEASGSTRKEVEKKVEKKEEAKASSMPRKRGSRMAESWILPRPWGEWAMAQGMPEARVRTEADRFRDYWLAKSGREAAKLDWQATWRNWIRTALERAPQQHGVTGDDQKLDAWGIKEHDPDAERIGERPEHRDTPRGKAALNRTFKTKAEAVNARDAFERLRDQRSGGSRDAANDMPALLAPSEEEAGPLPVRDVQAGRGGLELLALRRDRGVLL